MTARMNFLIVRLPRTGIEAREISSEMQSKRNDVCRTSFMLAKAMFVPCIIWEREAMSHLLSALIHDVPRITRGERRRIDIDGVLKNYLTSVSFRSIAILTQFVSDVGSSPAVR